MMDKTRSFRSSPYEWRWRHIVIYAGALGWWAGLIGQILWNVLGAVTKWDGELREDTASVSLRECLQGGLTVGWNATNCVDSAQSLATFTLVSGCLSIWWNPCLATKLHGRPGRMVGLSEFYKLQGILALCRLLAWYALGRGKELHLDMSTFNGIHATMLALNMVVGSLRLPMQIFRMLMFLAGLHYISSNGSHRHNSDSQFPRQSRAAARSRAHINAASICPAYAHHAPLDPVQFSR